MDVSFPPSTTLNRFYVVLRPFSVSFYKDSTEFAGRPYRVIPTSLLDTIPQLRRRTGKPVLSTTATEGEDGPLVDTSNASKALASGAASNSQELAHLEQQRVLSQATYVERLTSIHSHVELCTVDCSSALLHPLVEHANAANESFTPLEESGAPHENVGAAQVEARGEEALQEWFGELKAACLRVEEVAKKRSGASELAITRRLGLLPKRKVLVRTAEIGRQEGGSACSTRDILLASK